MVLAPYVLWASYAYRRYCVHLAWGDEEGGWVMRDPNPNKDAEGGWVIDNLATASATSAASASTTAAAAAAAAAAEWCHRPLPDLYSHVQTKYWGVGALRYYQWRQLPNFALAAPALCLCASACLAALAALRPAEAPPAPATTSTGSGGGGDNQRLLSARRAAARFLPLTSRPPLDARWAATLLPLPDRAVMLLPLPLRAATLLRENPNPNPNPNPQP